MVPISLIGVAFIQMLWGFSTGLLCNPRTHLFQLLPNSSASHALQAGPMFSLFGRPLAFLSWRFQFQLEAFYRWNPMNSYLLFYCPNPRSLLFVLQRSICRTRRSYGTLWRPQTPHGQTFVIHIIVQGIQMSEISLFAGVELPSRWSCLGFALQCARKPRMNCHGLLLDRRLGDSFWGRKQRILKGVLSWEPCDNVYNKCFFFFFSLFLHVMLTAALMKKYHLHQFHEAGTFTGSWSQAQYLRRHWRDQLVRDSEQSGARPSTCSSYVDKSSKYNINYRTICNTCNTLSRSHGSANFSGILLCIGVTGLPLHLKDLKNFFWHLDWNVFPGTCFFFFGEGKWDMTKPHLSDPSFGKSDIIHLSMNRTIKWYKLHSGNCRWFDSQVGILTARLQLCCATQISLFPSGRHRQLLGTVFGKHHLREPWKADDSDEVSSGWVD